LLAALAVAPRAAFADGSQTGLITGQVVDAAGAGVAAVQVTVSGPQIRRTEVADDQGRFRFPALGVGTYDLHAELLGLAVDQHGVHLSIGRTAEVRLRLVGPAQKAAPPAAAGAAAGEAPGGAGEAGELTSQESIQVVAEPSVIDRFATRVGNSIGFDFIDALPLPRAYQAVALLLPGVSVTTMDGNPNVNGALRTDNQFLIDGVDTTDPATGLFGLNLAYQAIQEVSVTAAAAPAEYGRSSGGVVNVVTRSATNEFQGITRFLATNPGWNSRYGFPSREVAQIAPEIDAANATPNKIDPELALSLGGPLLRDRLWFFGAYDDSQSSFLGPTAQGTTWNRGSEIESSAAKATWQVDPSNTVVGQFTSDSTSFAAFDPFDRGDAENLMVGTVAPLAGTLVAPVPGDIYSLEHQAQDGRFEKLQWNSALRQDMSAEMTLADQSRDLTRQPLNSRGLDAGAPHLVVTDGSPLPTDAAAPGALRDAVLYNGITDQGYERRPRRQGNLVLDGFVQLGPTDNELKAGVDFQRTASQRSFNFPGQAGIDPATGRPVAGQLFVDMNQMPGCDPATCPAFNPATGAFQPYQLDQFWARPTTVTNEQTLAFYLSDAIAVERWLVSIGGRFEAVRANDSQLGPLLDSNTMAPRLAVTYDASGDRKVLLTSTYGRYYEPFLHSYLDLFSSQQPLSGYTPYVWNQASAACAGQDPGNLASPCWVAGTPVGFTRTVTGAPESDLHRSWLDELTLGFERQVTSTVGISLYYIHRRWHDLWDDVEQGVFDGKGNLIGTTSQVENLPNARRQQQSLQLLVQKRYADHWQLLGSYTRSRTEGNLFDDTGQDPSGFGSFSATSDVNLANRYGLAPYDRRDQVKVLNIYRWLWRRVNLSFGSSILYESGLPYQMEEAETLGLLFLTPRGSQRLGDVVQLDLALGGEVQLMQSGLAVEVKAEVFNVTDQKQILEVDPIVNGDTFGKATSILDLQTPRTYRLTLGLRF
jgi:Carboxypeptidase regulatory-like domain/TonB-dependent Receptor Plug Domain